MVGVKGVARRRAIIAYLSISPSSSSTIILSFCDPLRTTFDDNVFFSSPPLSALVAIIMPITVARRRRTTKKEEGRILFGVGVKANKIP